MRILSRNEDNVPEEESFEVLTELIGDFQMKMTAQIDKYILSAKIFQIDIDNLIINNLICFISEEEIEKRIEITKKATIAYINEAFKNLDLRDPLL